MIPILKVREIISMPSVTALPHLPPYVKGVTNLRGSIIPIVHLRALLDTSGSEGEGNTIIVLATGKLTFGIIVDGITGVVKADESDIEPPESFFNNHVDNIEGVAKLNNKLIVLLDTKKLLPLDDMSLLEDAIVDVQETDNGNSVEVIKEVDTIGGKVTVKELHDAKEFFSNKADKEDPRHNIYNLMLSFMDALSNKEYQKVEDIVGQLEKESDSDIFNEVGKITRKLHTSLDEFKGAIDSGLQKLTNNDVPNAVDKLQFVIEKTEDAANKTMGIVERYFEESEEFTEHISHLKENSDSAAYLKTFKDSLDNDMTAILTAQQFQDVTGQTIKKVMNLVNTVEVELLTLITKFGIPLNSDQKNAENMTVGSAHSTSENIETEAEKVNQSDVQALLNDYGF
jgi:chemotaxis protein CheZ